MTRLLLAASALVLAGCETAEYSYAQEVLWRCDGGATFKVRYTTKGNAEVSTGNNIYKLPGVKAASGVRYTDGNVEYWEKGAEAMLNGAAGGPYANCRS